ncbi:RNA polymerase sigma factor [bacterium]|jgi:RNA polymerase sigma-70 factor, ECF subfamily|nr:RNA polymerase sigma factor [bacterium]MBT4250968.1 RNA polymerase sigma factor [bacterium]MBT4597844.1 RNA polymerase sigma factor [bacterium]MBT6753964.1 RNA polymerase sigma factor [bacterium]MBT7037393.1 RNA polymerase sigma factor [bacterium]
MKLEHNFIDKNDFELIELAKQDSEYFGILMSRYQEKLFWYVKRISYFTNEDIEDILQEVLIKAYRNLNEFDASFKFSSWIYRVTHNRVVDEIRKRKRQKEGLFDELKESDVEAFLRSSIDLEQKTLSKDCFKKAREAIEKLPLKYREAMILRFLEEKNYEEIMDILERPKGSVATLIARGKKILKRELKQVRIDCL